MAWAASVDFADLAHALDVGGVVFGPVNNAEDLVNDPHFRENGSLISIDDPELGELWREGVGVIEWFWFEHDITNERIAFLSVTTHARSEQSLRPAKTTWGWTHSVWA